MLDIANLFATISTMVSMNPSTERSLVRTIAGASRKLDEDLKLSDLQAIDKVQKLDIQFREHWYGHPWLVLENGPPLSADVPVATMLAHIGKHGHPIGIVGVAAVTSRRDSIFVMHFRADSKNRKTVEKSAQDAKLLLEKARTIAEQQAKEIVEDMLRKHGAKQ